MARVFLQDRTGPVKTCERELKDYLGKDYPEPKEDPDFPRFYREYRRLGGILGAFEYGYVLDVFWKMTNRAYVSGEGPLYQEQAYAKWEQFIGSKKEARRVFESVDNTICYS